ncbi:MAG: hypothetical protein E7254_11510 [Lachnospiraceae bacterium]|nr:hypothetical protein [Lachnospiraceae bacterium]
MRDRKNIVYGLFCCLLLICFCSVSKIEDVYAELKGEGSNSNPYEVSEYADLKDSLTTKKRKDKTTYIKICNNIAIKNVIKVEDGDFIIYSNKDYSICKSTGKDDEINEKGGYKYCIHVGKDDKTSLVIGDRGDGVITLNGNRGYYEKNKVQSSGWMFVGTNGTVTLGSKVKAKNMINNKNERQTSNFTVKGKLILYCEITNCKALNGGAVSVIDGGNLCINKGTVISECNAVTEGGAVFIKGKASLTMTDGTIRNNSAGEEGGGIFVSDEKAEAEIKGGLISSNTSGNSSGGIFSGYGAKLIIGSNGNGPEISNNSAGGSGGGIKCNGGEGDDSGGITYIYGGYVINNKSGKNGGGISVGNPGKNGIGKFHMENAKVCGNNAKKNGGGIWIYKDNAGISGEVSLNNNSVEDNSADEKGGGVYVNCYISMTGCDIKSNRAKASGGGIYIASLGRVTALSGKISDNKSDDLGNGVYVEGLIRIGNSLFVGGGDIIYLFTGKYVEVIQIFNYNSDRYFNVDSKEKALGTKLILVSATNITSEYLLYGNNMGEENEVKGVVVAKRIGHTSLSGNLRLRSCNSIGGGIEKWIWISRPYNVKYMKNIEVSVDNMPLDQYIFYGESINLPDVIPSANDYEIVSGKMWNTREDGSGTVYKPGSKYSQSSDITLYAIWKRKLVLSLRVKNRYFLVGQKVNIDESEIVRKVTAFDNLGKENKYKIYINWIEKVYDNGTVKRVTEKKELSTVVNRNTTGKYNVKVHVINNEYGKVATAEFVIKVLRPQNDQKIRFIEERFFSSINGNSTWKTNQNNRKLLEEVLRKDAIAESEYDFDKYEIAEKRGGGH